MIILLDIGNTRTHAGLASTERVIKQVKFATASWFDRTAGNVMAAAIDKTELEGAILCSVVPDATSMALEFVRQQWRIECLELTHRKVRRPIIDYPRPETIGPDRLANAIALSHRFEPPSVAIDLGTAITFDVLDHRGHYVGGIIAPGLSLMSRSLSGNTALLPQIELRETRGVIGKSTVAAMQIGILAGSRGLVRHLIAELKRELNCPGLTIVATGGDARLIAAKLPEITNIEPLLTLEGLRLAWRDQHLLLES
ncbi:MAG: type III pantothenate kinase [Candidatus Omnitrophica bacterium]|nr:type III pantothenate kinase [Candidatus Omnitrophota bacterium]